VRRLVGGLVAATLTLGFVGFRLLDPTTAPAVERRPVVVGSRPEVDPPRVLLFGDSLAYQSREAFLAGTAPLGVQLGTVSTRPGAALCDDRDAIVRDLESTRPDLLVLEYSGNSFTPCMTDPAGRLLTIGSTAWRDRYRDDLDRVVTTAAKAGTQIVWATAPPVVHVGAPVDYPARIASVVRHVAARLPNLRVADTGAALAGPKGYAPSLPCRPDERALCREDRIAVRAADGLHFDCIGAIDGLGGCVGYSAGARRYGDALAAIVLRCGATRRPRTEHRATPAQSRVSSSRFPRP
jgi:hypothetical protein